MTLYTPYNTSAQHCIHYMGHGGQVDWLSVFQHNGQGSIPVAVGTRDHN